MEDLIMRRHLAALALLAAIASPTAASAQAVITYTDSDPVPANNDFIGELAGLGYTDYTTSLANISLLTDATITFFFLGSESGFNDTFLVPSAGISYTELGNQNHFGAPILLGSGAFSAGSLAGLLSFISDGPGAPGVMGTDPFGIFLPRGYVSGDPVSSFILGYDDQINDIDDNHDDLMILALVAGPVPEPGTWATLLLGFGLLGAAMRRKTSKVLRLRSAIA
jgi:hypothetical protein